jgi:hypothetical protein
MTVRATTSSTITTVRRKVRRRGEAPPARVRTPRAKAVSVPMTTPQPPAEDSPRLKAR